MQAVGKAKGNWQWPQSYNLKPESGDENSTPGSGKVEVFFFSGT